VSIFSISFSVHSNSLTRAQISAWAGVESHGGFDIGDPLDPLDPEGILRRHTAWSFVPEGIGESETAEPWMERLRPVLEGVAGRPLPDTESKVFAGVHNGQQSGWFYLDPPDLALIAAAGCALVVDSYDFEPKESRMRRTQTWILEHTGVYGRRRARWRRARDRARADRIAARQTS